eukprot:PhF_6_TR2299/c0_g1_i3/m.4038/K03431/glmM; phosphoglucosamine mutase
MSVVDLVSQHLPFLEQIEKLNNCFLTIEWISIKSVLSMGNRTGIESDDVTLIRHKQQFLSLNVEHVAIILSSNVLRTLQDAVVNLARACELFPSILATSGNNNTENAVRNCCLLSRMNLMGTDGLRGKVLLTTKRTPLLDLALENAVTPALVRVCCAGFQAMVAKSRGVPLGDVVVGEDGRDALRWGGALKKAVLQGFHAPCQVTDVGIVPTAMVPYVCLFETMYAGVMITASHNPSNQNGIKFFVDGRKMLPEEDYRLTAFVFAQQQQDGFSSPSTQPHPQPPHTYFKTDSDRIQFVSNFILSSSPAQSNWNNDTCHLVIDSANGATHDYIPPVMAAVGITSFTLVNDVPNGTNINHHCGVADLEGEVAFTEEQAQKSPLAVVREVQRKSHQYQHVFGIAMDGDGDRGFVLYGDVAQRKVVVLDGDVCAFHVAGRFAKSPRGNGTFVCTVESDLAVTSAISKAYQLETHIVPVGDKWIGNFQGKQSSPLRLGAESSGHLIFPIPLRPNGKEGETTIRLLRSGFGLVTCLWVLRAVVPLSSTDVRRISEPYQRGYSHTAYVYYVTKSLFYPNSPVWSNCLRLMQSNGNKNNLSLRIMSME